MRTQVSLPSPSVFLRVIGQFMRWLRNSIEWVLPSLWVSLCIGLTALSMRLTPPGTSVRLDMSLWTLLLKKPLWIRVRHTLNSRAVMSRARNVPAEVMVTLGLVQAHSVVLDLCGTAEFRAP